MNETNGPVKSAHAPADGLVIDTRSMQRRAGAMIRLDRTVPAPGGWAISATAVPAGSPLAISGRLEGVVDGVLVTGTAGVHLVAECSRCLDPIERTMSLPFQQLFEYPDQVISEADDEDPLPTLDGDLVDLESVLRDAVVLELPMAPLCQPDCLGLCAECGQRLADDPDHVHQDTDPRWAALAQWETEEAGSGRPTESVGNDQKGD